MKTEALIVLKKVQSLQRGQDLQDVGNLNFRVEIFQLEAKEKFVKTLKV